MEKGQEDFWELRKLIQEFEKKDNELRKIYPEFMKALFNLLKNKEDIKDIEFYEEIIKNYNATLAAKVKVQRIIIKQITVKSKSIFCQTN
jgi:hypothetical protein